MQYGYRFRYNNTTRYIISFVFFSFPFFDGSLKQYKVRFYCLVHYVGSWKCVRRAMHFNWILNGFVSISSFWSELKRHENNLWIYESNVLSRINGIESWSKPLYDSFSNHTRITTITLWCWMNDKKRNIKTIRNLKPHTHTRTHTTSITV